MKAQRARRVRLDVALVQRGMVDTRARAQAAILAGEVYLKGVRVDKPGMLVPVDAVVAHRPSRPQFVSRGGDKLDHALHEFRIDPVGLVAADVGASTGGFTDCLLQRGVRRVYAIDVGTGQLHWRLRNDPRVLNLERRDVRSVTSGDLDGHVDLVVVDVAFISLAKVLPAVIRLVRPDGNIVALLKPQFEVGPAVAKRGVVRDPGAHRDVLIRAIAYAASAGWPVVHGTSSPITGPDGNIEFFLHLRNVPAASASVDVAAVVSVAHATVRRPRPPSSGAEPRATHRQPVAPR